MLEILLPRTFSKSPNLVTLVIDINPRLCSQKPIRCSKKFSFFFLSLLLNMRGVVLNGFLLEESSTQLTSSKTKQTNRLSSWFTVNWIPVSLYLCCVAACCKTIQNKNPSTLFLLVKFACIEDQQILLQTHQVLNSPSTISLHKITRIWSTLVNGNGN